MDIDYDALAAQHGAVAAPVDYDALAAQHGAVEKPEEKKKGPTWYDKLRGTPVGEPLTEDPNRAGLAQRARIVDAGKQAVQEIGSGSLKAIPGVGAAELGLNALTGIGSSIAGGLSGLGSITKTGIENQVNKGFHIPTRDEYDAATDKAAKLSDLIQQATTYQPRTGQGKLGQELMNVPLNAVSQGMRSVGGDVGGALGNRAAGEAIGGAAPAIAATLASGAGVLRGAGEAAAIPKEPMPGRDFTPMRDLTPEQMVRFKNLISQGIKPTLAQITRDPEQWRFEEQTGAQTQTNSGQALHQRAMDTNDALIKAVDEADKSIKGKPTTATEAQTGHSIASALEKKAQAAKANINSLYENARNSGETKQNVNSKALEKYIDEEVEEHPSMKVIQSKLQRLKEKNGGKLTVDDAETLYRTASDQTSYGDPSSVYMGRVKQRINEMTDGAGGDLYRAARQARLAYGMEFEDRAGIARLIEKKPGSRTDYRTPTEDVFKKTVLNGSRAELNDVIQSLKDIDLKKDQSGAQAIRNLQKQTVNYLLDKATEKGIPNAREAPGFSATQFRNAVNAIGEDKLNDILGPQVVKNLQTTMENAKTVKQAPAKVGGSDTAQNFRDFMTQAAMDEGKNFLLSKVPGGQALQGYLKSKAQEQAIAARTEESLNPRKASPQTIKEMIKQVEDQQKKKRNAALAPIGQSALPLSALVQSTQQNGDQQQ